MAPSPKKTREQQMCVPYPFTPQPLTVLSTGDRLTYVMIRQCVMNIAAAGEHYCDRFRWGKPQNLFPAAQSW